MPLGERKIVACLDFGSYFQMLPACANLPEESLQRCVNVMSLKYTMPSGLVATPSVSVQPPSKTGSSLAPAGRTLWSPVGAGKPGSSARAAPAAASVRNTHSARAWLLVLDLCGNTIESPPSL